MDKKNVAVIVMTGIVCLVMATALVTVGICQNNETKTKTATSSATATTPVNVNNTICPVTGSAVDMKNPVTVEYNGKIYNLCCSMCPKTFKSNPEKYSKIAEEQAKSINK